MKIVNMDTLSEKQIMQAAQMLVDEFLIWMPTFEKAMHEVTERWDGEEDATFLAVLDNDEVIGWIGMLSHKNGSIFEIHPLVV